MKRNPRKLRWTKSFRKAAGKELVVDSTLALAARRNVPIRYDRARLSVALTAMRRVAVVRARRERAFYTQRMAGNRARQRATDRKLVEENAHLLPRERGSVRVAREERELLEGVVVEAPVEEMLIAGKETVAEKETEMKQRIKGKPRVKKRLLVGGGVEDMEVD